MLPFVLDLSVMMWNKDLYEEAGLDPEKGPATLEEFAAAAKAVQALGKEGVYGTSSGGNCGGCLVFTWFPTIWASGDEVMNEDGTESLLASDTAQEVYATWKDLGTPAPSRPARRRRPAPTWVAGFQEGNVGVMPYPATLLLGDSTFDVGVAGIPGVDGGASTFVGGDGIGISKDSKLTDQAWNFLSWMMSEEAQVEVLAKNGDVVARSDLADNEYAAADPRLVTINEVAAEGQHPVRAQLPAGVQRPGQPVADPGAQRGVRRRLVGRADNEEITAVLGQ